MRIRCDQHRHEPFIIGPIDKSVGISGWGIGRKKGGMHTSHSGLFTEAIERCAEILREECDVTMQVDAFFTPGTESPIESTFARYFENWNIQLPAEAIRDKQSGKLHTAGWNIEYLFGVDGDAEYLDFYATHRMTNARHVRIHADGRSESLEAPRDMFDSLVKSLCRPN